MWLLPQLSLHKNGDLSNFNGPGWLQGEVILEPTFLAIQFAKCQRDATRSTSESCRTTVTSVSKFVDVIVVDRGKRLPLGRPWLTLAIDVATWMIAGFHIGLRGSKQHPMRPKVLVDQA
jgi:hypothetical protein